jgi:hypothetical protein
MEYHELIDSIRLDLDEINASAKTYFDTVVTLLIDTANSYVESWAGRDYFWSKLPEELQQSAGWLAQRVLALTGKLTRPVSNSLLLTEADQRDLSILVKTARAAVLLHSYSHWDTEVLHDEGKVLGVQRAGQSEDRPLQPSDAQRIFRDSLQRLSAIVDLLAVSERGFQPSDEANSTLSRVRQNTAFVMMWMDPSEPELDDICDLIKEVFNSFGIRAIRADDIEHEGIITERILHEISTSEFLIADLTGARPSVYYEVGYAHALNKRVILFRKRGTQLHFDLAGYNCPDYANLRELREKLTKRLEQLTNKKPRERRHESLVSNANA